MGSYYPETYYTTLSSDEAGMTETGRLRSLYNRILPASNVRRIRAKMALVRRTFGDRRGRALDIGVGDGEFLEHLAGAGWEVEGTDYSPEAARITGARLGGKTIHVGSFEDLDLGGPSFDLITFWDVLEHLYRPLNALRNARGLLNEGGALIVSVPNLASLESRVLGRRWPHLDVPRHLSHFTPATLEKLILAAGFRTCMETTSYRILTEHMPRAVVPMRAAMDGWTSTPARVAVRLLDDAVGLALAPVRVLGAGAGLVAIARP
jgi:2-polyprenyl-3-methyl-5-hydroxy-6-metoxy-1,4-benzoquinol methylase